MKIGIDEIEIELKKHESGFSYLRESKNKRVEKIISSDGGNLVVNPVEPVNLPSYITNFLLVNFKKNVVVAPGIERTVYIKFPVEIGVFVSGTGDIELIDVFSLAKQKYTLYGDPRYGVVCRLWESEVYDSTPKADILKEGVMELFLVNRFDEWVEVSKCVLNVYLMKIFYSDSMVYSKVKMEVNSKKTAETRFLMKPPYEDMKKAVEIFTPRKVQIAAKRYFMEWGI